jgi:cobalt-zinc-cadmium efflux system membrane fusion protein
MKIDSLKCLVGAITLFALMGFLAACSREQSASANGTVVDPSQVKVEESADVNLIKPEHPERFQVAAVELRSVREELKVTGSVVPEISRSIPVVSLSGGRVVEVKARLGDEVKKGQPLLSIISPDISAAFSDYQKFQADEVLSRKQLARVQLLYEKGAIAQKDLQIAEDAEQKARVDVSTAVQRIRILGADPDHPSPTIEITAPSSGTIVEQNITAGTGVKSLDNTPNLFVIADLSRIWILCDVYENALAKVHVGDRAEVRLNAYPDKVLTGRVSNIGRVLDPATRTVKVRLELDNASGLMRPNMFASVTFASASSKHEPVIPSSAILQLHDKSWVFHKVGDGSFRRQEIQTGTALPDGKAEVLSGLSPGDQIAVNALQFSSAANAQ